MSKRRLFGDDSSSEPASGDPSAAAEGTAASEDTSLAGPNDGGSAPDETAPPPTTGDAESTSPKDARVDPPRAAPKAGEGTNTPAREVAHPELEPPPPPAELRQAPTAPGEVEREGIGSRPSLAELKEATAIRVRTLDEKSAGIYVAGIFVTPEAKEVSLDEVRARGESHLRMLATDPRIEVELAD